MPFQQELIITHALPGGAGSSYTISSRLGDTLRHAEALFGERDKSYTLLGVEFASVPVPLIWYPGDCRHVLIRLASMDNVNRAIYQLAHETVHCLTPTGGNAMNILEEGMATYFAELYMNQGGFGGNWSNSGSPVYDAANALFKNLIAIDADIIKKARAIQPIISMITADVLIQANNNINQALANNICQPFVNA
jgi:hypothetical protein